MNLYIYDLMAFILFFSLSAILDLSIFYGVYPFRVNVVLHVL